MWIERYAAILGEGELAELVGDAGAETVQEALDEANAGILAEDVQKAMQECEREPEDVYDEYASGFVWDALLEAADGDEEKAREASRLVGMREESVPGSAPWEKGADPYAIRGIGEEDFH